MHPLTADIPHVLSTVRDNIARFGDLSPDRGVGKYELRANEVWTTSFWVGMLWLSYQETGDPVYRAAAERRLPDFADRLKRSLRENQHDLGFLYTLTAIAEWQVTGNQVAQGVALEAARMLIARQNPAYRAIQAWGFPGEGGEAGRVIVDSMMNLPLLYWASDFSGDPRFRQVAFAHAERVLLYMVRPDHSTAHTFFFDPVSGDPLYEKTHQGFADSSMWSRGQAWAIYGFALSYAWTGQRIFLDVATGLADRWILELGERPVPPWDFRLTPDAPQYLDSSAAAITACGMLEIARHHPQPAAYVAHAHKLLGGLQAECREPDEAEGLLRHGCSAAPFNTCPDGYLIYGDYYYLEALLRLKENRPYYWAKKTVRAGG